MVATPPPILSGCVLQEYNFFTWSLRERVNFLGHLSGGVDVLDVLTKSIFLTPSLILVSCIHYIVVNDKKRRLTNFENLWKLLQKNPRRILSSKTDQVKRILKTSYSILSQKSVQWNHETKNVFTKLMYRKQVIDNVNRIKLRKSILFATLWQKGTSRDKL